jgi:hypothetical protein
MATKGWRKAGLYEVIGIYNPAVLRMAIFDPVLGSCPKALGAQPTESNTSHPVAHGCLMACYPYI